MADASGWVESPDDRVARIKKELLTLNIAELQHIINYLQKERDDILIAISFTHNFFVMDPTNFRGFKNWLQAEGVIEMDELVAEAISQMKPLSVPADGPQGDESRSADPAAGHNGPAPPVEGWGC